jgi:hypothetical protein
LPFDFPFPFDFELVFTLGLDFAFDAGPPCGIERVGVAPGSTTCGVTFGVRVDVPPPPADGE